MEGGFGALLMDVDEFSLVILDENVITYDLQKVESIGGFYENEEH